MNIILSGLGELDEPTETDIRELANRYGLEFYPTYYDWELKGNADSIEKVTEEMWGMPRNEWTENLFQEREIENVL